MKTSTTTLTAFNKKVAMPVLVASFFWSANFSAMADSYGPGFSWRRFTDWTVQPVSDQGTTHGNAAPDALGNAVWGYEWTHGGGGLFTANPWYTQPRQKLVWDANWYTTGVPGWALADDAGNGVSQDYNPFVDQNQITLNISPNPPIASPDQIPLVRWINPTQQTFQLNIAYISNRLAR